MGEIQQPSIAADRDFREKEQAFPSLLPRFLHDFSYWLVLGKKVGKAFPSILLGWMVFQDSSLSWAVGQATGFFKG